MMKGSITIYLLLSLILVIAVICLLTESARVNCINARLRGITYMAADSCFAEYAAEIFDDYGIMALWKDDAEFISDLNGYIHKNLDYSDLGLYQDVDMGLMRHEQSALGDVKRLTDDQGTPFNIQVYEYMDYFLVREALEKFVSYLDIYGTGSKVASFLGKIGEYSDVFIKLADSAAKIQSTVDRVKSAAYNPRSILSEMNYALSRYLNTGDISYIGDFNVGYWDLVGGRNRLVRNMQQIEEQVQTFDQNAGVAGEALEEMQKILDEDGEGYDPELRQALQGQIDDLMRKTADTNEDYYSVRKTSQVAGNIIREMQSLDDFLEIVDTYHITDHAEYYLDLTGGYLDSFLDADINDLGLNIQEYTGKKQDAGFLSVIGSLFTDGLLKAVAGNHISRNRIDTQDLPSAQKGTGSGQSEDGLSGVWRTLEFGEYVVSHFGCFTSPANDNVLQYEAEYIIAGKNTDKENLGSIAERLVLMRSGLNLTAFVKDAGKMEEAQLLAEAVIGFTGMELLVQVVKLVIMSLWCMAEAMCDVKALLEGKKVPVIKDSNNWAVSASGLSSFRKSLVPAVTDEAGLSYVDHLRILLFLESAGNRTFRTMDLIQENAQKKYNSRFRMDECIASVKIYTSYSAKSLFTTFGFINSITGSSRGRYSFRNVQEYAYTKPSDLN